MPLQTENLKLKKPLQEEYYDVDISNSNLDIIDKAIGDRVVKVTGKGLSTNDYSTAEKEKLATLNNYDDSGLRSELDKKADKNTVYTKQETDTKLSEKADKSSLQKQGIVRAHYWLTGKSHGLTLLDTPPTSGAYVIQFTPDHSSKVGDILQIRSSNSTTDWKLQTVKVGEEDGLQDNTFVAGFPVTLSRINDNCFFKSGGGANNTLPPQIRNFAVTSGNAKNNTLSWALPSDRSAYEGLIIVRKIGSAPTKVSDGTKINLSKTATSYTDTGLTNDTKYYYRAFPYNSKKQYQTELTGAVAYGIPKAILTLADLPVGTLVKDTDTKYYNAPIVWKIADQNHTGYPVNSTTLISDKILTIKCVDAREPNSGVEQRKRGGNNRYIYSNIRQWLNKSVQPWYVSQHNTDAPPNINNVLNNAYESEYGFLKDFSISFISSLLATSLVVAKANIDGSGTEDFTDKMFLASLAEVNCIASEVTPTEGTNLSLFTDSNSRTCRLTSQAINQSTEPNTTSWVLRTPRIITSDQPWYINCNGSYGASVGAYYNWGIRPLCNIKNNVSVSHQPDTDGAYIIQF